MALGLISAPHDFGDIGVIYDPVGMGESIMLKEYVRANSGDKNVILIEADPGYYRQGVITGAVRPVGSAENRQYP
ncbi:MAG: hypothetical protein ACR5LG_00695 [Sodalis sp. (in: enterobacteria)]